MKRRDSLKKIMLGAIVPCVSPSVLTNSKFQVWPFSKGVSFKSDWRNWPDRKWVGPEYWGNRLQDWLLKEGKVTCDISAANRNLHLLSVQKPQGKLALLAHYHKIKRKLCPQTYCLVAGTTNSGWIIPRCVDL